MKKPNKEKLQRELVRRLSDLIVDTGPLLALGTISALHLLSTLYSAVYISPSVRRELEEGASKYSDAREALEAVNRGWLTVIFIEPDFSEKIETITHGPPKLGRAQAESIVLCQQLHVNLILTDDKQAIRVAEAAGLRVIYGLDILLQAVKSGVLSKVQALSYVQKFEQAHQYSEEDLKLAREQIEEGRGIHERG